MIHATTYPSHAHLAAHLLDAHGRQVIPGEDASDSLEALYQLHAAAHVPGNDMRPLEHHVHVDVPSDDLLPEAVDRALLTALACAERMVTPEGAEAWVRERLVAMADTLAGVQR